MRAILHIDLHIDTYKRIPIENKHGTFQLSNHIAADRSL